MSDRFYVHTIALLVLPNVFISSTGGCNFLMKLIPGRNKIHDAKYFCLMHLTHRCNTLYKRLKRKSEASTCVIRLLNSSCILLYTLILEESSTVGVSIMTRGFLGDDLTPIYSLFLQFWIMGQWYANILPDPPWSAIMQRLEDHTP